MQHYFLYFLVSLEKFDVWVLLPWTKSVQVVLEFMLDCPSLWSSVALLQLFLLLFVHVVLPPCVTDYLCCVLDNVFDSFFCRNILIDFSPANDSFVLFFFFKFSRDLGALGIWDYPVWCHGYILCCKHWLKAAQQSLQRLVYSKVILTLNVQPLRFLPSLKPHSQVVVDL